MPKNLARFLKESRFRRAFRREQQRLIDEADRIQRTIDELEKKYQDMTTPRPEPVGP